MRLAIMQPYFFPYIGYYQLISAADKFVLHDDINFIKGGWINRNRILMNGNPHYITVNVKKFKSTDVIRNVEISDEHDWKSKILNSVKSSYFHAPYYGTIYSVLEKVINFPAKYINELARQSIIEVNAYLEINTPVVCSSSMHNNKNLKGQDKVLDICFQENAGTYINPIGGTELYQKEIFLKNNIELKFLKPDAIAYKQYTNEFVPWLSIIDLLMFNSKEKVQNMLCNYQLI